MDWGRIDFNFIKMLEKKTLKQIEVELNITNGQSYQTVPHTKLLGQKNALKQWLKFSNERCIGLYNHDSDKTPFLGYIISNFHDKLTKIWDTLKNPKIYMNYLLHERVNFEK